MRRKCRQGWLSPDTNTHMIPDVPREATSAGGVVPPGSLGATNGISATTGVPGEDGDDSSVVVGVFVGAAGGDTQNNQTLDEC